MQLNINPIDFFGKKATHINIVCTYDDLETLYMMQVSVKDATGETISTKDVKIAGEDYTNMDWNDSTALITQIETECEVEVLK
jgi:hypothetical protein